MSQCANVPMSQCANEPMCQCRGFDRHVTIKQCLRFSKKWMLFYFAHFATSQRTLRLIICASVPKTMYHETMSRLQQKMEVILLCALCDFSVYFAVNNLCICGKTMYHETMSGLQQKMEVILLCALCDFSVYFAVNNLCICGKKQCIMKQCRVISI